MLVAKMLLVPSRVNLAIEWESPSRTRRLSALSKDNPLEPRTPVAKVLLAPFALNLIIVLG